MRIPGRAAVGAAVAIGVIGMFGGLTGCSSDSGDGDKGGKSGKGGVEVAAASGELGGRDTACALPVRFSLAKSWKAEAVKEVEGADPELGSTLLEQGPVTLVCEIDAKPAGHIGFLRVWTGDKGKAAAGTKPRQLLKAFMAGEKHVRDARYSEVKAGDLPAAEISYILDDPDLDESKRERALAVMTPQGGVVLHLGGLDSEEHEAMLPAYELAKQTMAGAKG
ncbi:lipoprotein [Streptomyces sp. ME19-01-6]|uniref:lipoprotein n=1 Tax=Streptomyces sp. ME19-01-6 TaxID=3028686 RepID=UPI0029A1D1A7|nr:lipoprotein [Streptomyces sp. ME19-01-6]MDX3227442.1 lipoprotein [Streptomyces sp. ME19-01-6]